jgi:Rrf2 family protein
MSYSLAFSQAISIVIYVAIKIEHEIYDFVPTREIAHQLNIAAPSVVKILQHLSRAGLIETREGARGGIRLLHAPDEITLLDVFSAIEQERPLFRQQHQPLRLSGPEVERIQQRVNDALASSEQAMKTRLHDVTIAALYR